MADEKGGSARSGAPESGIEQLMAEIGRLRGMSAEAAPEIDKTAPLPDPAKMRLEETHRATEILKERREKIHDEQIERIMKTGGISSEWTFKTISIDPANGAAVELASKFCQAHSPKAGGGSPELLLISGLSGTGKSVLANCVAYEWLHERGRDTMIIGMTRLEKLRYFAANEDWSSLKRRQDAWRRCVTCDLLVIDGLCENGLGLTVFQQKVLPECVRTRREKGLSTMITITLPSIRTLHQAVGDYTFESFKTYNMVAAELMGRSRRPDVTVNGVVLS
jgi:DNA replication protein DnaC